jgi:putative glycosyltransferase (TIGR04372 family)
MKHVLFRCCVISLHLSVKVVFALIVLPLMYLVDPIWRFRMGSLVSERIGHLAYNTDLYLRQKQIYPERARVTDVFFSTKTANRQLLDMWKRHLKIVEHPNWLRLYFAIAPMLEKTRFHVGKFPNSAEHYEFTVGKPTLSFNDEDHARGCAELSKMGIGPDDWFICIHARTSKYLTHAMPHIDWSYHDFRDCDISTYLDAAKYIVDKGGYVIRMGTPVEDPLPEGLPPQIIDYATHFWTDFMDIYLMATCRFFLSSSSGLMCVAMAFDTPNAPANYVPYQYIGIGKKTVYIPKHLVRADTGKHLSLAEIHDLGLMDIDSYGNLNQKETYGSQGLEWRDNTSDEILGLCRDMMAKVNGEPVPAAIQKLQRYYHSFYSDTINDSPYAGQIASSYVQANSDRLFGQKPVE